MSDSSVSTARSLDHNMHITVAGRMNHFSQRNFSVYASPSEAGVMLLRMPEGLPLPTGRSSSRFLCDGGW